MVVGRWMVTGVGDRGWEADCVVNVMFNDIILDGCWGGVITCHQRWWWLHGGASLTRSGVGFPHGNGRVGNSSGAAGLG